MLNAEDGSWPAFRITINYVDAELLAYWDVLALRHRRQNGRFRGWSILATGVAFGFAGALAMMALGAVHRNDAAPVALIIFIGFWLGVWSPWLWATTERHLLLKHRLSEVLQQTGNASAMISSRGIATRRIGAHGFYSRAAIVGVTVERGLLLVWSSPSAPGAIAAIPLRLLDAAQRELILSLPLKR